MNHHLLRNGRNCLRLAAWARENGVRKIRFMELFSGPYEELEKLAEEIAQRYLDWPRYGFIAKTIQRYELDFWRAISI